MGNRIFLRAFEYDDLQLLNEIRNDSKSFEYTGGNKFFISSEYDKKWIEDKIFNNQNQLYLAICLNNKELIGYLGISNVDHLNKVAQWAGIIIHQKHAGNGYATEATSMLLQHVFEELGLNRFYGYWLESHLVSIKMAQKVGFIKEGLLREFVFKKNEFHNAFIMSILRNDYNDKK